jgi:hypothetical protein
VQLPNCRNTPCRLSATAFSICSQLPSISGDLLLYPQPEDTPCSGDNGQGGTLTSITIIIIIITIIISYARHTQYNDLIKWLVCLVCIPRITSFAFCFRLVQSILNCESMFQITSQGRIELPGNKCITLDSRYRISPQTNGLRIGSVRYHSDSE